jgi:hypothetical protein
MKSVSLNWTVADTSAGKWFVIASHPRSLCDVVAALETGSPGAPRFIGKFESCGVGNGVRLERHLQSWSDAAPEFKPSDVNQFRTTLRMMAELSGGLRACRWQLARPTDRDMRLDVQIELAAPESARGE